MLSSLSTLFKLGAGVKSLNERVLPNTPLLLGQIEVTESTPLVKMEIVGIKEEKSLQNALGFSMKASGSALIPSPRGEIDLSAHAKANFAKQITVDNQHIYFVITKKVTTSKAFTGNIVIDNSVGQLLVGENGRENFYALYGDKFVTQITSGCEIIVVIKIDSNVLAKSMNSGGESSISVESITAGMSGKSTKDSFSGVTNAGCWVYIDGVPGTEGFTLDTTNLGQTLQSVKDLMGRIDVSKSAALLSCKVSPYSIAQLDLTVKTNQVGNRVKPADVTRNLLQLDADVRGIKGLWDELDETNQVAYEYVRKYEQLSEIMSKDQVKYGLAAPLVVENQDNRIVSFKSLQSSVKKALDSFVEKRASASVSSIITITAEQSKESTDREYSTTVKSRQDLEIELKNKKQENLMLTQQKTEIISQKTRLEVQKHDIEKAIKKAQTIVDDLENHKIPILTVNSTLEKEKQTRTNQEVKEAGNAVTEKNQALIGTIEKAGGAKANFEEAERGLAVAKNTAERESLVAKNMELSQLKQDLEKERHDLVHTLTAEYVIPVPAHSQPQTVTPSITRREIQYTQDAAVFSLKQEELTQRINAFNNRMSHVSSFQTEQTAYNTANDRFIEENMTLEQAQKDLNDAREKLQKSLKQQAEINVLVAEKERLLLNQRENVVAEKEEILQKEEDLLENTKALRDITRRLNLLEEQCANAKTGEQLLIDQITDYQAKEKNLLSQIPGFQKTIDQNVVEQATYQVAVNTFQMESDRVDRVLNLDGEQSIVSQLADSLLQNKERHNQLKNSVERGAEAVRVSLDTPSDLDNILAIFRSLLNPERILNITDLAQRLREGLNAIGEKLDLPKVLTRLENLLNAGEERLYINQLLERLRIALSHDANNSNINIGLILSVVQRVLNNRLDKEVILEQARIALAELLGHGFNLDNSIQTVRTVLGDVLQLDCVINAVRYEFNTSENNLNKDRIKKAVEALLSSPETLTSVKVENDLRTILMAEGRLNTKNVLAVLFVTLDRNEPTYMQQVQFLKKQLEDAEKDLREKLGQEPENLLESSAVPPEGHFAKSEYYLMRLREINQKITEMIENIAAAPSQEQTDEQKLQDYKNKVDDAIQAYPELNEMTYTCLQVIKPNEVYTYGCFGEKKATKEKLFSPQFGNNVQQLFWRVTKKTSVQTGEHESEQASVTIKSERREHPISFEKVTPVPSDPAACCFPQRNRRTSLSGSHLEKDKGYFFNMFSRKRNVQYAVEGLQLGERLELYAVDNRKLETPEEVDQKAMTLS